MFYQENPQLTSLSILITCFYIKYWSCKEKLHIDHEVGLISWGDWTILFVPHSWQDKYMSFLYWTIVISTVTSVWILTGT